MLRSLLRVVVAACAIIVGAIVISLALVASAATIGTRVLEKDAEAVVTAVADRLVRTEPFSDEPRSRLSFRDVPTHLTGVKAVAAYTIDGSLLRISPRGIDVIPRGDALRDPYKTLRDQVLRNPEAVVWHQGEPPGVLARNLPVLTASAAPVFDGNELIGVVVAAIDQSVARETLSRSLRNAGWAAAIVTLFVTLSLGAVVVRRGGSGDDRPAVKASIRLPQNAHQDGLTGLASRIAFQDALQSAIAGVRRGSDRQFAVLVIGLDRFKEINDSWGHAAGDALLRDAAERIKRANPQAERIARLSGDEFAILLEGDANPRSMKTRATRLIEELSKPFDVEGNQLAVSASVGLALYPVNADTAEQLFRCAHLALNKAKREGGQTFRYFDAAMDEHIRRRAKLESDMRKALVNDEFVVFYQPQLDLKTGELCGYEALLRWERPNDGLVSPGEFIPVAEETGLIKDLGEWVLLKACEDAATWIQSGTISVNFSAAQFRFPGVDEMIGRVLQQTGLAPNRLELEVPESLFLSRNSEVMDVLHSIKSLGVRIAMDDFGTGYSSLSYLTQFPFDKIKIDRSFVSQLGDDPQIGAIVSSIVGLGRSLSVDITAEGVETKEQVMLLKAAGCSIVQGFLFGAPQRIGASPKPAQSA